ncbi:hypothetical protein FRC18_007103 [Serendipita sp. 400]|nr:hypothetical protein FRC18_007103 [Serendipita sp. 400]
MRPFPYSIVPAIVGSLVCFVLLILATISSPMVDTIYFLKLITAPDEPEPLPSNTAVTFGVFGMSSNDGRRSLVSLGYSPSNWSGLGVEYVVLFSSTTTCGSSKYSSINCLVAIRRSINLA